MQRSAIEGLFAQRVGDDLASLGATGKRGQVRAYLLTSRNDAQTRQFRTLIFRQASPYAHSGVLTFSFA